MMLRVEYVAGLLNLQWALRVQWKWDSLCCQFWSAQLNAQLFTLSLAAMQGMHHSMLWKPAACPTARGNLGSDCQSLCGQRQLTTAYIWQKKHGNGTLLIYNLIRNELACLYTSDSKRLKGKRIPKGLLKHSKAIRMPACKLQPPLGAQAKFMQQDTQQAVSTIRNAQHMLWHTTNPTMTLPSTCCKE